MLQPRPHDLLWLSAPEALTLAPGEQASWASVAWLTYAPVVVRRATLPDPEQVAVGLRGRQRHERAAATVARAWIAQHVTPETVASAEGWHDHPRRPHLAALHTLATLAPILTDLDVRWGVTGGVGFALASGLDVLHEDSDLDLLIRAPQPLSLAQAHALAKHMAEINPLGMRPRVDIQVEAPAGAFALAEWLRTGGPVMLKTATGPMLVPDPWRDPSPLP